MQVEPLISLESTRIYTAKYFYNSLDIMFITVYSLRAYTKTAGSDFYSNLYIT